MIHMPKSIKPAETEALYRQWKAGSDTARESIIEGNMRLVSYLVTKIKGPDDSFDDLHSIGLFGLIKAVDTFDVEKGIKFATYASRVITNDIFMEFRKQKRHKNTINLQSTFYRDNDGSELLLQDTLPSEENPYLSLFDEISLNQIYEAMDILRPLQRQAFSLYYVDGMTQRAIAAVMGVEQSYVSRLIKKSTFSIQKYIAKQEREPERPKFKEEPNMTVATKTTKNRKLAIHLLQNTLLSISVIARRSHFHVATITSLAKEYRPADLRKALKNRNPELKKAAVEALGYIIDGETISLDPNFVKLEQKAGSFNTLQPEPVVQNLTLLVDEKETPMMKEESSASLASKPGAITRKSSFAYQSFGDSVSVSDFLIEIQSLIQTVQSGSPANVSFSINVETATQS